MKVPLSRTRSTRSTRWTRRLFADQGEIKEGLIPVNMLYVSQSLTDSLSMEAFYQLEWDQTVIDNCGTFFAPSDTAADGCNDRLAVFGADVAPGVSNNTGAPGNPVFVPRVIVMHATVASLALLCAGSPSR